MRQDKRKTSRFYVEIDEDANDLVGNPLTNKEELFKALKNYYKVASVTVIDLQTK